MEKKTLLILWGEEEQPYPHPLCKGKYPARTCVLQILKKNFSTSLLPSLQFLPSSLLSFGPWPINTTILLGPDDQLKQE